MQLWPYTLAHASSFGVTENSQPVHFDESGFALDPTIPYAWQEPKSVIELPARRYGRINVLGFMNRHNDLHTYMFDQSIHTGVVIACFDAFCHTITKKTDSPGFSGKISTY